MEKLKIHTEYIKLDQLLKWAGIVGAGTDAKYLVTEGFVKINGQVCLQRGKKVYPGDHVDIKFEEHIEFMVE
ncbi:MAG: RNA-binding S4 domain-containing protein [Firmicutes bacterium]|nr:RNA-binding S4 domain-containing protein [Bacillota bacterium]